MINNLTILSPVNQPIFVGKKGANTVFVLQKSIEHLVFYCADAPWCWNIYLYLGHFGGKCR